MLDKDISKELRMNAVFSRVFSFDIQFIAQFAYDFQHSKTIDEEKILIKKYIAQSIDDCEDMPYPTLLHKELKHFSGIITDYTKYTKNKNDEIELNLFSLIKLLELNNQYFLEFSRERTFQLYKSIVIKTFKILILIKKAKDVKIDLIAKDLKTLGNLISSNPSLMRMSINVQLDVNWLVFSKIPNDIELCFKQVKQSGILK
jgi:hypothetical protein